MGLLSYLKKIFTPRNTWAPDDDRWYASVWAPETSAGVKIDETNAMAIPAVWACIKILSEDIGSLPLHLYTRLRDGKQRATNHPLYLLLHDRPNPEMSAMSFRETMASHILAWGNAYALKDTDTLGRVQALWPLPPNMIQVYRDKDSQEIYYKLLDGSNKVLNRDQVLHIPGLAFNGLVGYSPIGKMREAIGMTKALEEFGSRFFGQGTHPGVVVSHPGQLGAQAHDNLKKSLTEAASGLGKAHRLMLLEEGMKLETIGIPPEDAQFLETRRFQLSEIARIYKMPLHKLQEYDRGMAFASVEQFSLDYVIHTLRPWLVRIEQAYNWQLFSTDLERRRYFWEHLIDALLRGDLKTRYDAYAVGRNWGWLSADDIRELENMNPLPDDKGKIYLQPLNMIEAGAPMPLLPEKSAPEEMPAAAYFRSFAMKDLFQDVIKQILSREANGLKRIQKGANGNWSQIVDEYYNQELEGYIERKIEPAIRAYVYQQSDHPEESVIKDEAWHFVQNHIGQSKDILCSSKDRERVLEDFSDRAPALATQAMIAINERLDRALQ